MKKLLKRILALLREIFQQFSATEKPSSPPSYYPSAIPIPPIPTFIPQWHNGLVLVCSQCTETSSEDLQNWLKSQLKFDGLWGEYRVVGTNCLGVCPQGGVVVILHHDTVGQQCFILSAQGDRKILYSYIKQMHRY